jgi:hypothetical protein
VRSDHAEVAASALFESVETRLEVAYLGPKLPIAFLELLILTALSGDGFLKSIELSYTPLGEPNPVLQNKDGEN